METIFYIISALAIAGAVLFWYWYKDKIKFFFKGGTLPASPEVSLSELADKFKTAEKQALEYAASLEERLAKAKADLTTASNRLTPTV